QRAAEAQAASFDRRLLLRASGPELSDPQAFLDLIRAQLVTAGLLAQDAGDSDEAARWQALSQLLYRHRWGLLSDTDQRALREQPGQRLANYRRYLYSPVGGSALGSLPGDPAGTYRRFLEAALPADIGQSPQAALVVLTLRPEALDLKRLASLYPFYRQWQRAAADAGLEFQATGAPLYSAFGAHSASREISTLGLSSLLALALLLWLSLRSWRGLALTLLCVGNGLLLALVTTVLLVGEIHLLTLVFGATLIGIAADYALHYLAHSLTPALSPARAHAQTDTRHGRRRGVDILASVYRGLSLSALSSAAAFAALALLPFPGIRQIGIFMATGLLGSFATVCLLFPALYRGVEQPRPLPRFCQWPPGHRRGWQLCAALLLLSTPGLLLLNPRDEVRDFYASPPALAADQAALSKAPGADGDSRSLLVRAPTVDAVLAHEEALQRRVAELGESFPGQLSTFSQLVPPAATQRANFSLLRRLADSGQLAAHLTALGLGAGASARAIDAIPQTLEPLRPQDLDTLALPTGMGGLLGCTAGECASYVLLRGPVDDDALTALLRGQDGVQLVAPVAAINALLAQYRGWVKALLLAGGAAACLVLTLRNHWRLALGVTGLALTACLFSLGLLGYLRGYYSIVNLLALLLIVGVSIDYGVFRALTPAAEQGATSLAITLSALTSVLAFGMLGLSSTPIIRDFGQTIAIGLTAAYSLSWLLPLQPATEHSE
ncbi:MAG: MMPL family transporter, partial [Parahaliea sp.]